MSTDFSQMSLDNSTVSLGQKELTAAKEKIQILEQQLKIYEERDLQHQDLQTHMRNSYTSFNRTIETVKRDLALAELRKQELKEDNIKLNAQLSGKIDLLLKERSEYMNGLLEENQTWFVADRATTVWTNLITHKFETYELQIDTNEKKITHVRGINLLTKS
jgi:hypothetical protein